MINKIEIRKKELGLFLAISKIPYKEVIYGENNEPCIVLEGGDSIMPNLEWFHATPRTKLALKNDKTLFGNLMERLGLFQSSDAFDANTKSFDIAKFNAVLSNSNKALRNKSFKTNFMAGQKYGGCTSKRSEIFIYYKEFEYRNKNFYGIMNNAETEKLVNEYMNLVPGFNYHELGHTIFTISFKRLAKIFEEVYFTEFDQNTYKKEEKIEIINRLLRVTNSFEDGRMENLMIQKFPGAYPYFASTAYNFLVDSIMEKTKKVKGEWIDEHDCVLISARKYLSADVRQWVYNEYINSGHGDIEKARRVNGYVNKYITLSWRKNLDELVRLMIGFYLEFTKELLEEKQKIPQYKNEKELSKLLEKLLGDMMSNMNQMGEGEDGDDFQNGEGAEIEDETLKAILEKIMKEGKLKPGKNKKGGNAKPDKSGKPATGAGAGERENNEQPGKKGEKNDSGEGEGDVDEGDMKAGIKKEHKSNAEKKATHKANMKQIMGKTKINCKENRGSAPHNVTPCMKKEERKLEAYFKQLITMCRNGYMYRRKSGAVDVPEVRRQMKSLGTKVFRKYKRNMNKAFDVDIAFVLDISSSMSERTQRSCEGHTIQKVNKAAEQLWICFSAASAVGGKHKTFTFNSGFQGTLPEPRNKNEFIVPIPTGGTTIGGSLMYALNYLEASQANNKWLVALTDGEISDPTEQNEVLDSAKRMGITTGKINLGEKGGFAFYGHTADDENDSDNAYDFVYTIPSAGKQFGGNNNARDIVAFFKKVYEISARKNGLMV